MPFMEWDESFELGIQEFDGHHQHLVHLLNTTYDSIASGASYEELGGVLDELVDYATYHFAAEEYWMKTHDYPNLPQHREEHERFCSKVVEIQKDFCQGRKIMFIEVLQFLNNWLSDHIRKVDCEYGRFAKGLSHEAH